MTAGDFLVASTLSLCASGMAKNGSESALATPKTTTAVAPQPKVIPRHIAIIMDGNGRWAKKRLLPRVEGHRNGAKSVRMVVEEARRLGVRHLTLFAFSTENWRRPQDEVGGLMHLFVSYLESESLVTERNSSARDGGYLTASEGGARAA